MTSPIPVAILCGGKGTRLREETEFRPKRVFVKLSEEGCDRQTA